MKTEKISCAELTTRELYTSLAAVKVGSLIKPRLCSLKCHSSHLQSMDAVPENQCHVCGKTFHRASNFLVHQIKHLKGYDCTVPTCLEPHHSRADLNIHENLFHSNILGSGQPTPVQQKFTPEWELDDAAVRTNTYFQKHTYTHKAMVPRVVWFCRLPNT